MRKLILAGLAALAATALFAGPAFAWHVTSGQADRDCDSVTLTTTIPDEDWFTGTATLTYGSQSASTSNPGSLSVTVPLDKADPAGTASGTVTWSDSGETEPVSADYGEAPESCTPPETTTPPTTAPPVDAPDQPDTEVGTPTNHSRTPAAKKATPIPAPELVDEGPPEMGFTPSNQGPQNRTDFTG